MFVYVISYDEEHAKIGVASNLRKRLDGLRTGCPFPLSVRFAIQVKHLQDAYRIEGAAHALLNGKRASGREWFRIAPERAYDVVTTAAGNIDYETIDCTDLSGGDRQYTLEENTAWFREMLLSYSDEAIGNLGAMTGLSREIDELAAHFAKRLETQPPGA
jgi:T5orf172 domain